MNGMNRTQKIATVLLAISLIILFAIAIFGCGPDVSCDCPDNVDCLITVEEGKGLVQCVVGAGDDVNVIQECLMLYGLEGG
jgi:hypothetical protein